MFQFLCDPDDSFTACDVFQFPSDSDDDSFTACVVFQFPSDPDDDSFTACVVFQFPCDPDDDSFTACDVFQFLYEPSDVYAVKKDPDDDSFTACGVFQFLCEPSDVYAVKKELEARQLPVRSAEVVFLSTSTVPMDSSSLEQMAKVLEKLEEHPDVLKVYTNVVEASQWDRRIANMYGRPVHLRSVVCGRNISVVSV